MDPNQQLLSIMIDLQSDVSINIINQMERQHELIQHDKLFKAMRSCQITRVLQQDMISINMQILRLRNIISQSN